MIVNRIDCDRFDRGEVIVFADSVMVDYFIGTVEHLPGDTVTLDTVSYVIPMICCKRCGCKECRYYLVKTSCGRQLVHKHQIIGKAYKIF